MIKSNATIKVDTEESWKKATNFVPDQFTIIVYTYDAAPPKIKIGNGINKVGELPFLVEKEVKDTTLIL